MTQESQAVSEPDTGEQLSRQYRGYDDDHNAETLADFGLDLSLEMGEGVRVETDEVEHINLQLTREDEFPIDYVVIQPVGVGPTPEHNSMFSDVDGMESVFVQLHPVRDEDFPGQYFQPEPEPTITRYDRVELEKLVETQPVLQSRDEYGYHWIDPDKHPEHN